jgi:hypothetical protein
MCVWRNLNCPHDDWAGDLYRQGLQMTEACHRACGAQPASEALKDTDVMVPKF